MKTVILTGLIGSGKSAVSALLRERGIPVYDSDARTKDLYDRVPGLVSRLEKALEVSLRDAAGRLDRRALASVIFASPAAREKLEAIVYPLVKEDFLRWRDAQEAAPFVVLESAVILSKPVFDGVGDAVVLVTAPLQVRLQRVVARDGCTPEEALLRMQAQSIPEDRVDVVLSNDGTPEALSAAVKRSFFRKNSYLCKILKQTE